MAMVAAIVTTDTEVFFLGIEGRADTRPIDDLSCVIRQCLPSHGMSNMLRNANPASGFLPRIRGKIRVIQLVVDRLPEAEAQQRACVSSRPSHLLDGDAASEVRHCVVQNEADVQQAEQPGVCRCTGTVRGGVGRGLDLLVAVLSWVLELLVGLTLPTISAH